jgi:chaperone required for assembly of F1-ATPase
MRDLFEGPQTEDPVSAARRGARPALRKRFYQKATVAAGPDGHEVRLDDRPIRTPARRLLALPSATLGEAVAAEWEAQRDLIDPANMPLTRLVNAIIDGVADSQAAVADEVKKYLASDLLFYRSVTPQGLGESQMEHWDPVLNWTRDALGANFRTGEGVIHVSQPEAALAAAGKAMPADPWLLGAVHVITTLTGSALLALAMLRDAITPDAAWQAAHVDEDWNMEQWGRDELALERRAFRLAEFQAAATVLKSL